MLDLAFNQCMTLLVIGFVFALIFARCLMAVVNRGFLLVDYAKAQLYPEGRGPGGGRFGLREIFGGLWQMGQPWIKAKMDEAMGVQKK